MPFHSATSNKQQAIRKKIQKTYHLSLITYHFKVKRAFTLIELLVVITILGILAGITMVSYGGTQERSRDSRRKTDLDAIKKALELAKQDSAGAYSYPVDYLTLDDDPNSPYIKAVPTDPKTSLNYIYSRSPAGCDNVTTNCTSYTLITCLENGNDSQKDKPAKYAGCTTAASYSITPN